MAGSLLGALLGLLLSLGPVPASAQVPCLNDWECGGDEVCQLATGGSANKTGSCALASKIIFCNMDAHCDAGGRCFQLDDNALLKLPVGTPAGICIAGRAATTTTAMTTLPVVALTTTLQTTMTMCNAPYVLNGTNCVPVPCLSDWDCDGDEVCQLPTGGSANKTGSCALASDIISCNVDANCDAGGRCFHLDDNTLLKLPVGLPPGICVGQGRTATTTPVVALTTTLQTTMTMPPQPTTMAATPRTTTTVATGTTTAKSTTTQDQSFCALPASDASVDISSCLRKSPPATCTVTCADGYSGLSSQYSCSVAATGFVGTPPTCTSTTRTTTTRATTTTTTTLARCMRVPYGVGIDNTDCANKVAGTNCTLACTGAYTGASKTLICDDSGTFQGDKPTCSKLQCTTGLPAAGYDVSACSGKEVGQFCQVTCLPGYIFKRTVFQCLSNGTFQVDLQVGLPTCTRLPCTRLPTGAGVNSTDCQGKLSRDNCTVTCRDGYSGTSVALTCGNDGGFAATGGGAVAPTCAAKVCSVPDALTTGATLTHNCGSVNFGRSCIVSCADGYTGTSQEWTCGGSGPTLTGTLPTCTGKTCTRRPPSGDGVNSTNCDGTATGQTCLATCLPGYDATGSGTVTCQANGAFTVSTLVCTRKACAALTTISGFTNPPVENSCGGKIYKQTCSAKCTFGYTSTSGAVSLLKCGADGSFTNNTDGPPNVLTCSAKNCTRGAPNMRGVISDCSGKTTGQTCTASADVGYSLVAGTTAKNLTCQASGAFVWVSGEIQVQPGTCDVQPTWGAGVQDTCDNKTVGQTCWAYCQSGYSGTPVKYKCDFSAGVLTIQPNDGTTTVSCSAKSTRRLQGGAACTNLPSISASMKTDCTAGEADGSRCIVECADGYNISGSPTLLTCNGGTYDTTDRPTCNPIACTFNAPDGVGVTSDCSGRGTGSTCTAQCGPGYTGTSVTFTCKSNGEFNGTSPTCSALACSALSLGSQYATTDCTGKTTGQTCLVGCADGYTGSPATYTCGTSQAFIGTAPTCAAAMCTSGVPTSSDLNVSAACSTLTTGQTCSVACANGYSGAATTFTCGSSGSLTGTAPTCTLQTCTDLSPGASFSHTCTSKTMGTSCTVSCASGYSGSSVNTFQCAWDASAGRATLQGSLPTCTGIPCVDNIPTGDTIAQNCGSVPTGSTCSASCVPGYTGTPATSTLTCLASGALSGTAPTCAKMTCPAYQATVSYDASLCAAVVFGDSCLVSCQPGYNGTAASLACQLNSANTSVVLTGSPPTCTAMQCVYNLPQGAQFQHSCSGRVTGETCTVSCAAGWAGTPASLVCGTDQTLVGTMPTCVIVTTTRTDTSTTVTETSTTRTITSTTSTMTSTTRTDTTTMTTTRTRTVTTRVNSTEKVTTVLGSMKLQVADPASFVSDPDAKAAVEQGIAAIAGVPAVYVNATLSVVDAGRRLGAGNTSVAVDYTIGIPDSMSSDLPPIDSILGNLTAANAASMKAAISAALDAIAPGKYAVNVVDLTPPQATDDGSVAAQPSSSDDKKKKTGIIVGCVVGIIGGCCCIWCVSFILYKCFRRKKVTPSPVEEIKVGAGAAYLP